MAFAQDVAGAELLEELLTLPQSAYAVARLGNVIVLHARGESETLLAVTRCLRL